MLLAVLLLIWKILRKVVFFALMISIVPKKKKKKSTYRPSTRRSSVLHLSLEQSLYLLEVKLSILVSGPFTFFNMWGSEVIPAYLLVISSIHNYLSEGVKLLLMLAYFFFPF